MSMASVHELALRMGDNCIVLAQRVGAWCGHAPILEEDIALANTALDLIGQTRMWLDYAAELEGKGGDADQLAFFRDERQFRNVLLVEQPNGDFSDTLMRQFLFDSWHYPMLEGLLQSSDDRVVEIAQKSIKEVQYHRTRSTDLVVRLGDGTQESHDRMQAALDRLWSFTGELVTPDNTDDALAKAGIAPDLTAVGEKWRAYLDDALAEATLTAPENAFMRTGGKDGLHTEHMGFLLAEMQSMQRAYPGQTW